MSLLDRKILALRKTALVTGITGQDGSYLADLLLEKDYRVVGLVRRNSGSYLNNAQHLIGKVDFEYGDLTDQSCLNKIVKALKPDEIYNMAAQSQPHGSWKMALFTGEVTALGPQRLLEAMLEFVPKARFYQASSSEIFGNKQPTVVNENAPLNPNNPYGVAKAYAHRITQVYRESYNLFAATGILFNHESPRRGFDFVTRKIARGAAELRVNGLSNVTTEEGKPIVENGKLELGNLDAQRDWGFAGDYVDAMWRMLQLDWPDDFVIGTGILHTVRDVCEIAFTHVGLDWREHVVESKLYKRPTEISAMAANYHKATQVLGWTPQVNFVTLIRTMVDADLAHLEAMDYA